MIRRSTITNWTHLIGVLIVCLVAAVPAGAQSLVVDGDFEGNENGVQLRSSKQGPPGWYESRKDGKDARLLLKLSSKNIRGNKTKKAMLKANPLYNTYLSQKLAAPQTEHLTMQWDICIKEIFDPFNRTGFMMLGNASVKGRGPNATGAERFVFLAFEKASKPDKINLFAFEGGTDVDWDTRTVLIENLDIKTWYTVKVDLDIANGHYFVTLPGVHEEPVKATAFKSKKKPVPTEITHISFASWNDGPGTVYVDNVR
jgi:hypothetical protein